MGKPKAADDAGGGQTTFARGWGAAAQRRRTERQAFAVGVTVKPAPAPFIRTKVRFMFSLPRRAHELSR